MESLNLGESVKSLLFTFVIVFWLYWLWTRRDLYRFALKFPGRIGSPIIGTLRYLKSANHFLDGVTELFRECKSHTIAVWFGTNAVLLCADPEMIEKVLSSQEILDKACCYSPLYHLFGGGLVASPAKEWHTHRRAINPSFHHKVLLGFIPIFNKSKNAALRKFDSLVDGQEHKLISILQRLTMTITVETTMGKVMQDEDQVNEKVIDCFTFLLESAIKQIFLSFANLDGLLRLTPTFKRTISYLNNFIDELLQLKILKMESSNGNTLPSSASIDADNNNAESVITMKKQPQIFIDQALEIYKKKQFTWQDIISESNTIVSASFETTANGIYSTLLMLALHPDVQERLFEEIVGVFPDKNFEMDYEHMEQLPYLERVISETLRLTPSIPLFGRAVSKDTALGKDLILPKGLQILISVFHLHRRTDIWGPNANKFDPDHFLPENLAGKHSYAYIPFSKGVRNCIGWRYALFAMRIVICGLVRNYKFSTDFKFEDLKLASYISLKYVVEPKLKISKRE